MRLGGVILCGGRNTRMGRPKALLPFGDNTMLECVVQRLSSVVGQIAVVAAAGQQSPALTANCLVPRDEQTDRGPLEGLRVGLTSLDGKCDAAYVTACNAPLLVPEFIVFLASNLGDAEIAVPVENGQPCPLSAIYRVSLGKLAQVLLDRGESRLTAILEAAATREIAVHELRQVDPDLRTLINLNTIEEYQRETRYYT